MEKSKFYWNYQAWKAYINQVFRANPLLMSDFRSDSSKKYSLEKKQVFGQNSIRFSVYFSNEFYI